MTFFVVLLMLESGREQNIPEMAQLDRGFSLLSTHVSLLINCLW